MCVEQMMEDVDRTLLRAEKIPQRVMIAPMVERSPIQYVINQWRVDGPHETLHHRGSRQRPPN